MHSFASCPYVLTCSMRAVCRSTFLQIAIRFACRPDRNLQTFGPHCHSPVSMHIRTYQIGRHPAPCRYQWVQSASQNALCAHGRPRHVTEVQQILETPAIHPRTPLSPHPVVPSALPSRPSGEHQGLTRSTGCAGLAGRTSFCAKPGSSGSRRRWQRHRPHGV